MKFIFTFLLSLIVSIQCLKESEVKDFVEQYEKLSFSETHLKKRSSDDFELAITLEGKDYTLVLSHNYELTQSITLDSPRSFLKGTVKEVPDSIVRLTMEGDFLEGIIVLEDEHIYVENIEVNDGEGHNTVLYKSSSVKRDEAASLKTRCKQVDPIVIGENEIAAMPININSEMPSSSSLSSIKKAEAPRDCRMAIIADITFSNKYGSSAQSIMLSTINTIEALYLKQVNTGLPVAYSYVVTNPNDQSGLGRPSNNINQLLRDLGTIVTNRNLPNFPTSVCLAHLFTYQDFGGILGLAYLSSSQPNTIGGICSPQGLNTGVSSFQTGSRESSVIVRTVTVAHEIGHNFGSSHDTQHGNPPGNPPQCNPQDKYMMFPSVNTGSNAQTFSSCSLYLITEALRVKSTCFTARTTNPTNPPTNPPTTRPPTNSPTNPPTTRPPTSSPTSSPTNPPSTGDQCVNDPRLRGLNYVGCTYQPNGLSPCILLCAQQGKPQQCYYFTSSNGQYIYKNAGTSCGSGRICNSAGSCELPPPPTNPPTRAPTLAPTTAPNPTPPSSTSSPQPQCPYWAPTQCPLYDCMVGCVYSNRCYFYAYRPDGTPCGGSGRCLSGNCRPVSSGVVSTECDPSDACCDQNGNLRPHGYVCRKSENSCDIEEICDPNSSRPSLCPEDLVMPGGTPCNCSNPLDPTSCSESCGVNDYRGVCGKVTIQSCQGKVCQDGYQCTLLKGEARCVPKEISTCQNNCGKSAATTVGCFCDESCKESGDCCDDYEDFCVISQGKSFSNTPQWVWGIVGAVIALVVVSLVIGLGVFFYKRRKSSASV